jgi:hypothetical protein
MVPEYVVAIAAETTQLYIEETPLITGPLVERQVALGPVRIQFGAPVGAIDPAVPVIVAVKVMIGPPAVLDWMPVTFAVGSTLATTMERAEELTAL